MEGGRAQAGGPRRGGSLRRFFCLVSVLYCSAWSGCGGDGGSDTEVGASEDDRYAHRFLPFEDFWKRESEIPTKPPGRPGTEMWEVSRYPGSAIPSAEHQRAADELVERVHESALAHGWNDYEKARADGFHLMPNDRRHYMKDEFLLDDRLLDPDRPEFLMFYPTPEGNVLTGFMFMVRVADERGPQVGGPLTVWHYHRWRKPYCYRDEVIGIGLVEPGKGCEVGEVRNRSPEMLHVWLVDRPDGSFASKMSLNPADLPGLLAKRKEERGY